MLEGLPLSPKQVDYVANSDARINVMSGSIRAGKSIAALVRWLIYCAEAPASGELVVVAKTTNTAASNVFLPLQDPGLFGPLSKHVHYTRGAPTATILGRHVRVIGANDQRSEERLRGMTCSGALVDEATLVPQEFWVQLLGRMSVPGAKLFASTNPGPPMHWLKRDFIDRVGKVDIKHWHFTIDDNPSLTEKYKADIRAEFAGLFYRRFVLGEWCAAENGVYDMFDIERHVVKESSLVTRWPGVGIDYGTVNPFVGLLVGVGTDGRLHVTSEYRWDSRKERRQKTDAEYSRDLTAWLDGYVQPGASEQHHGVEPERVIVDPSAASFVTQLWRDGWSPTKGDNSVMDGIRLVSSLLHRDLLRINASCTGLVDELSSYSWDDQAALKGEDRPLKVNDHGPDALRYLCATTEWTWRDEIGLPAAA